MDFKRIKIKGYAPFHVLIEGKQTLLFRANQRTYLSKVIKLTSKLEGENIAFYTDDPKFEDRIFAKDVTGAYEFDSNEERRPLFFYNGKQFLSTEIVKETRPEYEPDNSTLRVILKNEPVFISQFKNGYT